MSSSEIEHLITQGESLTVEFKSDRKCLPDRELRMSAINYYYSHLCSLSKYMLIAHKICAMLITDRLVNENNLCSSVLICGSEGL